MSATGDVTRQFLADHRHPGVGMAAAATLLLTLLLGVGTATGQDILFAAQPDRTQITFDDNLKLTVSIFGHDVEESWEPMLPPLADFRIDTVFKLNTTHYEDHGEEYTKVYTYVLSPLGTGTLIIDPITLHVGQKILRTDRIVINVSPGSGKPAKRSRPDISVPGTRSRIRRPQDIFTRAYVDKRKAYVFEQVTFTFDFYNRYNLFSDPEYTPPTTPEFWVEELPSDKTPRGQAIDGRVFDVQTIRSALFPTTPGKKVIGSTALETAYYMDQGSSASVVLSTKPIEIEVLPFPQKGKPASFIGAVGSYTISVEADARRVRVGDPISLRVSIGGTGNIRTVGAIDEPPLDDFKTYEPKATETSTQSNYVIQGDKIFEYVIIPKAEGTSVIGPFSLAFFNPGKEAYEVVSSKPISIVVSGSILQEAGAGASYPLVHGEIKQVGSDIRYIKADLAYLENHGKRLYGDLAFLMLQGFPVLAFVGALVYRRHLKKVRENQAYARERRAWMIANRRLKEARKQLDRSAPGAFYGAIYRTLSEFLEDKLGTPVAGLTLEQLSASLAGRKISAEEIENIKNTLDQCDFARFAPQPPQQEKASAQQREAALGRVQAIIDQLERAL